MLLMFSGNYFSYFKRYKSYIGIFLRTFMQFFVRGFRTVDSGGEVYRVE